MSRRTRKSDPTLDEEVAPEGPAAPLPVVALVGRPNVGKSTLFNRLVGGHDAIVEDEPGVTRDRRYGDADWNGRAFRVVDTGGLDIATAARAGMAAHIARQALEAVEEAQLVVFVLDALEGLTAGDRDAAEVLRRAGKPVLWVANKVDGGSRVADSTWYLVGGAGLIVAGAYGLGRRRAA